MREIPQNSGPLVGSPPRETTTQEESASSENDLFVGRAEALALLERALEEPGVVSRSVLVSGEAGVGKTRLVQEFARRAEARATNVAWGHCYDVEGEPPYRPFEQITKQLSCASPIGHAASPSDKEAVDHAFLAERKGDPEEWRERFLAGVGEALTSVASSEHLLLVVEDIQWADIGSLLLLNSLVDGGHRGLLVISTVRLDEALDGPRRKLVYSLQSKSIHLPVRGMEPRDVPTAGSVTVRCRLRQPA